MKKYNFEVYKGKNVLFITTKNLDYIRNVQELQLIQKYAKRMDVIGSSSTSYIKRILYVYFCVLFKNMEKIDSVFIGFAPQLVVPLFYWKFKKKITIDFFISVYDTLVMDRRKFQQGSWGAKFCKMLDKNTIAHADEIICDTMVHGQYFVEELNAKMENMYVLYLHANENIYYPRERKKLFAGKFTVLYFGSVLPLQGVDIILEAIAYFRDNENIQFMIIGPIGKDYQKTMQDNVKYIQWISQEELAELIAEADLCLAGHFNANIGKAKRTIPGKAYIYEAMGKTMILGEGPANHELFKEDDKHYFVEMSNSCKLAELIKEISLKKAESR